MAGEVRKEPLLVYIGNDFDLSLPKFKMPDASLSGSILSPSLYPPFENVKNEKGESMIRDWSTVRFCRIEEYNSLRSDLQGFIHAQRFIFEAWRDDDEVFNYEEYERKDGVR